MNYCKLYIEVNLDQSSVEALFSEGFNICVNLPGVEYTLFANDNYNKLAEIDSPTYPVDGARFHVEIDFDSDTEMGNRGFYEAISKLIIWLRKRCEFVVASCDFEDYIFESTGWNWRPELPMPPSGL